MNIRLAARGTGIRWTGFQTIVLAIRAEKLLGFLVFLQNKAHSIGP